jgi:hypothetical protein
MAAAVRLTQRLGRARPNRDYLSKPDRNRLAGGLQATSTARGAARRAARVRRRRLTRRTGGGRSRRAGRKEVPTGRIETGLSARMTPCRNRLPRSRGEANPVFRSRACGRAVLSPIGTWYSRPPELAPPKKRLRRQKSTSLRGSFPISSPRPSHRKTVAAVLTRTPLGPVSPTDRPQVLAAVAVVGLVWSNRASLRQRGRAWDASGRDNE